MALSRAITSPFTRGSIRIWCTWGLPSCARIANLYVCVEGARRLPIIEILAEGRRLSSVLAHTKVRAYRIVPTISLFDDSLPCAFLIEVRSSAE